MKARHQLHRLATLAIAVTLVVQPGYAGHLINRNNSVGGVSVNVDGVVGPAREVDTKEYLSLLRKEVEAAPEAMVAPVDMRMVSLRALAEACEAALTDNFGRIPEEAKYLAGIQRIRYVFVYPESNDIVLAGPGEGWTIDSKGNVVGVTTGRPVLQLDDLLVALRTVRQARETGISVSIDPTEEGYREVNKVLDQQRRNPVPPAVLEPTLKRAFGPQQVVITGVPSNSHFARVLVAADYRMKRLAMNLDQSPIRNFGSYLELIKNSRSAEKMNPRWWMTTNYDPLAASEDGLAWELRGAGVKVMTEDEFVSEDGKVSGTGRTSAAAQRWADSMTKRYEDLSAADPVFADLRNLMDLCVVAALIEKENLLEKAGCSLGALAATDTSLKPQTWNTPKTVAPEVSFLKTRNSMIVTASGGVQVESWLAASKVERNESVGELRSQARATAKSLWWQ